VEGKGVSPAFLIISSRTDGDGILLATATGTCSPSRKQAKRACDRVSCSGQFARPGPGGAAGAGALAARPGLSRGCARGWLRAASGVGDPLADSSRAATSGLVVVAPALFRAGVFNAGGSDWLVIGKGVC